MRTEAHRGGLFSAVGLCLAATVGHNVLPAMDWAWFLLFGGSWIVTSGAAVGFDRTRWLK
ncbi:hypothetical protein EON79_11115 [bacterium]|nr:MAG: hypothetical protein EON79_11115 [bacterium]